MSPRTGSERNRARRLRAAKRAREALTNAESQWLERYDRGDPLELSVEPSGLSSSPGMTNTTPDEVPSGGEWASIPEDGAAPADAPAPGAQLARTKPVCTIKDCPACAGRTSVGPQKCATTGEDVWPPIGVNAARMVAGLVLFVIGFAVKIAYRQPEIVDPTELELEELANSIIEVVRRRAGWVAAVDDLLGAAWTVGAYSKRARKVKALPAPRKEESDGKR